MTPGGSFVSNIVVANLSISFCSSSHFVKVIIPSSLVQTQKMRQCKRFKVVFHNILDRRITSSFLQARNNFQDSFDCSIYNCSFSYLPLFSIFVFSFSSEFQHLLMLWLLIITYTEHTTPRFREGNSTWSSLLPLKDPYPQLQELD